ncbi:PREDICTED: uncharacterized protein LOC109481748 [Branchiostoma belcheri]|uniref:Uncharacterized protein LOC109481748 n=1 Tax=Branchiostoma belcheri TaxID=7741 RepID=A0A6P4ZST3_BRABE|nr:PREDICTED: uncharacterized protein LOC109481748 [Branchiostoma belcheri]
MKLCAVVNCSNSSYTLAKWKARTCQTHGTKNKLCNCPQPFQLYAFPTEKKDPNGRRRWNKLINKFYPNTKKNWENKCHDRVCSRHFPDGKPTRTYPDPVLHLGYTMPSCEQKITPRRPPPTQRLPIPEPAKKKPRIEDDPVITPTERIEQDHPYTYRCDCREGCDCPGCTQKQMKIDSLEHRVEELEQEITSLKTQQVKSGGKSSGKKKVFTADTLKTDNDINQCTGLRSKQAFNDMYRYLEPHAQKLTYWKSTESSPKTKRPTTKGNGTPRKRGSKRKLSLREEFLLTLMRLRLGLTINFLAILFGLVPSSCSQIVSTWVRFLSGTLQPLIVWPSRHAISTTLPTQFKNKCSRIRCIMDCTEIFIERPRNLEMQAATWSDYKKHNTMKVLVGITPNGHISFLSKAYGGRASDVSITRKSGFLDLVEPNDVIMADRGFPIQEDLLLRHATLQIPPAAQGKRQMARNKVKKTKTVANLRIHVERAINRLKDFRILDGTFPISLLPAADDIIKVCAALVNLQSDLIK